MDFSTGKRVMLSMVVLSDGGTCLFEAELLEPGAICVF